MHGSRRSFLRAGATLATALTASKPVPANSRITVGFIGCGARAHELIESVKQHPAAEITAVVDAYTGRVERALQRLGGRGRVCKHYHDLLADKSIDAVVVATPDHWHRQMVLDAVRAGKDVYCEKPLTHRSSEGLEIMDAARSTGRIVQVGSQVMSYHMVTKAKELIREGRLGQITMIRAAYNRNTASGAWIYPIPPDASRETVNWEMFLGPAPKRPFSLERFFRWRCYSDYSGGVTTDLFVHLTTTIHFLMDAKMPSAAMAMGQLYRWKESREVPDTMNAILEYPEGFAVGLSTTLNNQLDVESGFQVLGTQGSLVLGGGGLTFYPEAAVEDNRWIVGSWPQALEDAYFRDPKVIATEVEAAKRPKPVKQEFREPGPEPTFAHFGHFFASIQSRKPYWEDATAGHRAAACAHMINLSSREKRVVEWDFSRDDIRA